MTIYDFFNSSDVAEHCRNINYTFSAMECAFLVWNSNHHTLEEKHAAWQTIIDTMPDESLPDCLWHNDSLHDFLSSLMKIQAAYIQEFISPKEQHIYMPRTQGDRSHYEFTGKWFFSSYDACLNSIKATIANYLPAEAEFVIDRYPLHSCSIGALGNSELPCIHDALILDGSYGKLSILDIAPADLDYTTSDERFYLNPAFVFENMPLSIPHPFVKGDIVIDTSKDLFKRNPCVFDSCLANCEDSDDTTGFDRMERTVKVWFQTDDDDVMWNIASDYLNLAYGVPNNRSQFLQSVSAYFQGKISAKKLLRLHKRYLRKRTDEAWLPRFIIKEEKSRGNRTKHLNKYNKASFLTESPYYN